MAALDRDALRSSLFGPDRERRDRVLTFAAGSFVVAFFVLVVQQHDVPVLTDLFRPVVLALPWLPGSLVVVALAGAAAWYADGLALAWAVAAAPLVAVGLTAFGVATVGQSPGLAWRVVYALVLALGGCALGTVGYVLGRGVRVVGERRTGKRLSGPR